MPKQQLKPIEERDCYAAMVMAAFDSMENQKCRYCGGVGQYMDCEGMPRICDECQSTCEAIKGDNLNFKGLQNSAKIISGLSMEIRDLEQAKAELTDALRKAVAWGDSASQHILYRENINWRYLDEAKETLARHLRNGPPT